nr:hypothetical protein [Nanoarchaeum sp.]
MGDLENRLAELHQQQEEILKQIDVRNGNKRIECVACKTSHKIAGLTAIQTHWYTPPESCTAGDYWSEGELQFICPKTGVVNRLMFDNYDVPWDKRRDYDNDPAEQFKRNYKHLFQHVKDSYDREPPVIRRVNNYYVDRNRKKFGLVKKRASQNDE